MNAAAGMHEHPLPILPGERGPLRAGGAQGALAATKINAVQAWRAKQGGIIVRHEVHNLAMLFAKGLHIEQVVGIAHGRGLPTPVRLPPQSQDQDGKAPQAGLQVQAANDAPEPQPFGEVFPGRLKRRRLGFLGLVHFAQMRRRRHVSSTKASMMVLAIPPRL